VPVHQPATLRDPHVHTELERLTPDLIVVAAYGKLLPRPILDLPAHGCINVHASLLPRHRGAAPIQSALLAGDRSTGVTIMQMNEGMDEGDILLQRPVPIEAIDTSESLGERLARVGAAALLEAIAGIKGGTLTPRRQDSAAATYAPRITKEMGRVDWTKPSVLLEREVRAFQPWPAAHTSLWGKQLKLLGARVGGESISAAPGTVVTSDPSGITVGTGDGTLVLTTMQLEGQRPLSVADFIRGRPVPPGTVFGS
jgi:methionyl-tRNA formyltransferase